VNNTIITGTYVSPLSKHKKPRILVLYVDEENIHGLNVDLLPPGVVRDLKKILKREDFEDARELYEEKLRPIVRQHNSYRIWKRERFGGIRTLVKQFV